MDEVVLWNRSLSQAELQTNMYERLQGTEPGLVAYWRMDEGAGAVLADSTANHFDAYLTNNPAWVKSCIPAANGALRFTGPGDFLRLTNLGRAAPTNEITVEFWANLAGAGRLFSLAPDDPLNRLGAEVVSASGAIRWQFGRENEGSLEYVPVAPITNTWQHFAFVSSRAGNFMRIYRNGEPAAWRNGASSLLRGDSDLFIGGAPTAVAEFRIWSVARPQEEIARDLNRHLRGPQPGLLVSYPFEERSGETAADASGQGHQGLLSNAVVWVGFPVGLAPTAITLLPSGVDPANATLHAEVNPHGLLTSAWFEWGTNLEQAPRVVEVGLGSAVRPLNLQLTGLVAGVTYHYRVGVE